MPRTPCLQVCNNNSGGSLQGCCEAGVVATATTAACCTATTPLEPGRTCDGGDALASWNGCLHSLHQVVGMRLAPVVLGARIYDDLAQDKGSEEGLSLQSAGQICRHEHPVHMLLHPPPMCVCSGQPHPALVSAKQAHRHRDGEREPWQQVPVLREPAGCRSGLVTLACGRRQAGAAAGAAMATS